MTTISENLQTIKDSTVNIKNAIINKGGAITGNITTYAQAIGDLDLSQSTQISTSGILKVDGILGGATLNNSYTDNVVGIYYMTDINIFAAKSSDDLYYLRWENANDYNNVVNNLEQSREGKIYELNKDYYTVINGTFRRLSETTLAKNITNDLGTSERYVVSQKTVTENLNNLNLLSQEVAAQLNSLGYTYIGTATPSTTPITITGDNKVFYIATKEGIYSNFGLGNISELSIIKSENKSWKVEGLGCYLSPKPRYTDNDLINSVITKIYISNDTARKIRMFSVGENLYMQIRDLSGALLSSQPIKVGYQSITPYNNVNISGGFSVEQFNVSDFATNVDCNLTGKALDKTHIEFDNFVSMMKSKTYSGYILTTSNVVVKPKLQIEVGENTFLVYNSYNGFKRIRITQGIYPLEATDDVVNIYVNVDTRAIVANKGGILNAGNLILVGSMYGDAYYLAKNNILQEEPEQDTETSDLLIYGSNVSEDVKRQYNEAIREIRVYRPIGETRTIKIANIGKGDIDFNWLVLYIYNGNTLEKTIYFQPRQQFLTYDDEMPNKYKYDGNIAEFRYNYNGILIYAKIDKRAIGNDGTLDITPKPTFSDKCYVDRSFFSEHFAKQYCNMGASTSGMDWHRLAVLDIDSFWYSQNQGGATWRCFSDSNLNLNKSTTAGTHDNVMMNQVAQLIKKKEDGGYIPDNITIMCGLTDSWTPDTIGSLQEALELDMTGMTCENWFDEIENHPERWTTANNIMACLRILSTNFPDTSIMLATVQDCALNSGYPSENIINVNELIKSMADILAIQHIDLFTCGISGILGTANKDVYTKDGVHPNDAGIVVLRNYMKKQLLTKLVYRL